MVLTGNKILITGGATGIGLGLTQRFVQEKNTVIICGRRKPELEKVKKDNPGVITIDCDLSEPAERVRLFQWIQQEHSDLNVLVNNAGIQNWVKLTDKDLYERARKEIAINIEAPLHLSSLFLDLSGLRTIINVTSGLSFVPLTKVPVYSATKAFFHSYTLSMRRLLQEKGIEVIELIPPALNTDLGGKGLHDQAPPVSEFIKAVFEQLKAGKNSITFGFSEQMANAGPEGLQKAFERMNGA